MATETWKCTNCTFTNKYQSNKCEMCGGPSNQSSNDDGWKCQSCAFENHSIYLSCVKCGSSGSIDNGTQKAEELIIKILQKEERKGKNIKAILFKVMKHFENEESDEKHNENKINKNNKQISLLHDPENKHVCNVGHHINSSTYKHLSTEECIICGHKNSFNKKTEKEILIFINKYNVNMIPFGPSKQQIGEIKAWGTNERWPLHHAAMCGDTVKIKQLLQSETVSVGQKMTEWVDILPITIAARYGQLNSVIELIKNGANPIPPPDKGNQTPYRASVGCKHKAVIEFYKQYIKYVYNFDINNNINVECFKCYQYDLNYNSQIINENMSNYVYCKNCTINNVQMVKMKQENNKIIEKGIINTLNGNPSISTDTLCQMKDVKSLHTILKEIIVSGYSFAFSLWLIDIDNFKSINTELTHVIADTKIEALGRILKKLEAVSLTTWKKNGYDGLLKIHSFRQGGDEFALVVDCNYQKKGVLQKVYERIKKDINMIKLENMKTMKHLTVSIGVCIGQSINNYTEMMKKADEAAEMVKQGGKNGMMIYHHQYKKFYKNWNDM